MRLDLFVIFIFIFFTIFSSPASAHPGRTAADGCHYCRTNCDAWGVPWNERHCHGGSTGNTAPKVFPTTVAPTAYIPPTKTPTQTPTRTPTPTITQMPTTTPSIVMEKPTVKEVKSAETKRESNWFWIFFLSLFGF